LGIIRLGTVFKSVLAQCANLKPDENAIVISDLNQDPSIPESLKDAVLSFRATPTLLSVSMDMLHEEKLHASLLSLMKSHDLLLICPSTLFPSKIRKEAVDSGCRALSMATVNSEMAMRCFDLDYGELSRVTKEVSNIFSSASKAMIRTEAGTDVEIKLSDLRATYFDGLCREPRSLSALPAGVVATVPASGSGSIVIDGSVADLGLVKNPIKLNIHNGTVKEIEGGREAEWLKTQLEKGGDKAFTLAEVGIGTNPKATYTGNLIEDERVLGSCHFGFGGNVHIGGQVQSAVHIDTTVRKPTVTLDGEEIVTEGRLRAR
jgi:leucyl aminopeptidase (aminopeptidase T)